ncbi:MAG: dihydrofolate reductase family protein [Acidobacteria bacterium]|nr:dihydrofolate reductase family protein [Acidobacteriota bacterium]
MQCSVFIAATIDGFIARLNHDIDFLPEGDVEEHGFTEFYASVDALVMGRLSYEKVLSFGEWHYGSKPIIVLSSRDIPMPSASEARVERLSGSPREIVQALSSRGWNHLYIDGGVTITRFLEAGLIQRMIITRVPVLIGTGIPLFGALPRDIQLSHVATRSYKSGLVQSEYTVTDGASG